MKALFVATVVKTHIMEFHIPYLKMLKEMGYETAVAARNDYEDPADCKIPFCDSYYDIPFKRSPLKAANISAYKILKKIIDSGEYDIIHCHTPVGAMIARLAAVKARKRGTKVIYTAHGFHFYKGAPLLNWLVYYPVERILAHLTDVLITINKEDYARAQKFAAKKVCYVPGVGVDTSKFQFKPEVWKAKREELSLKEDDFVLLSVGELIARKNHAVVLHALAELKESAVYDRLQYVICGRGILAEELKQIAKRLDVAERVHFLGYRNDISDICNSSNLFMFMSLQEGLPVALMEAMGCGLPVICSDIRGNTDLIENGVSGIVADNSAEAVAAAIEYMADHQEIGVVYAKAAGKHLDSFDIKNVVELYRNIYMSAQS